MVPEPGSAQGQAGRGRMVIASNRGPLECYTVEGEVRTRPAGGGLAVALASVARRTPLTWLALASPLDKDAPQRFPLGPESELVPIRLPDEVWHQYYEVFANPTLWFVQHGLTAMLQDGNFGEAVIHSWARGYRPANRAFADAIIREIDGTSGTPQIMLHDYHLYLTGRLVRAARPDAAIQHFIHIPWPAPHAWRVLPSEIVRQICEGLLGNDSVVFQTKESASNFIATCREYLNAWADFGDGWVNTREQVTRVWSNPISVDCGELRGLCPAGQVRTCLEEMQAFKTEKTLVRVDRLDPSKNIITGFDAFERLLAMSPDLRGRVTFFVLLTPSRSGIREYADYARAVFARIGSINDRYGTDSWTPVRLYLEENRSRALAGLQMYDALLVNSIADGLNLVAKEGPVVNEHDGVLVLSNRTGAYQELQGGALGVSPTSVRSTASAMARALRMGPEERAARARTLKSAISRHQLDDWLALLLNDLATVEARRARVRGDATRGAVSGPPASASSSP